VFYSDAIRLFLISRFGGWYSDLDMTIIRQLSQYRNVIASDNVMEDDFLLDENNYGDKVSNAIFHFDAGAKYKRPSFFAWVTFGNVPRIPKL
jgi:mannosyltransferase OCH1-like enzyme